MSTPDQPVDQAVEVFRLPDAGEGLTEADIVTWRVKIGDVVAVNDPLVEIETAKSLVELPSPFAGTVIELLVAEGDTVAVGAPIIAVATGTPRPRPSGPVPPPARGSAAMDLVPEPPAERTPVLVGYGPRSGHVTRRRSAVAPEPAPASGSSVPAGRALAKPPVRKLARDLGVDLRTTPGTGPGGIVTREDVRRMAAPGGGGAAVEGARRDDETRLAVKGVRKAMAAAMVASAFTAPQVTEWVQVDVTRTLRLIERLQDDRAFDGVVVKPLALVAKALLLAVRRHPEINASWDDASQEIVIKHYVHLGIAAATSRGLLVPNIKNADRLALRELAEALATLTVNAREGRSTASDLAGGTITITNVGVFGVDGGTPILNPGEAAILAIGAIRRLPWVHRGRVRPRWVTTLSLSFDHRVVDGELGSAVLADVAAVLERPDRALVMA